MIRAGHKRTTGGSVQVAGHELAGLGDDARALSAGPQILLADEPTGNLDGKTGEHVIDLLFDLQRRRQATLVLVTHETRLAGRCGRVVHMADGRVEPEPVSA